MYSQLRSITGGRSSIRNPRTCHSVVTGTHLTRNVQTNILKIQPREMCSVHTHTKGETCITYIYCLKCATKCCLRELFFFSTWHVNNASVKGGLPLTSVMGRRASTGQWMWRSYIINNSYIVVRFVFFSPRMISASRTFILNSPRMSRSGGRRMKHHRKRRIFELILKLVI
jgi:hypothetical protein